MLQKPIIIKINTIRTEDHMQTQTPTCINEGNVLSEL